MKTLRSRRCALSFCTAATMLAGCGGAQSQSPALTLPDSTPQVLPAAPQPRAELAGQLQGHLYVAGSSGSSGIVERFRIVDGAPESKPDLTYSGVGAPIAVDSHGYLYATIEGSQICSGQPAVVVYAPNSTSAVRTLEPGNSPEEFLGIVSLFVDARGFAYLGVSAGYPGTFYKGWAVYAYSPGIRGCVEPVQTFDSGNCNVFHGPCGYVLTGITMDARGNIHVSNDGSSGSSENTVLSFSSPITDPTQIAALTGSGVVSPWGLAVDASDELYVDNAGQGTHSFVAAYPATANGNAKPSRKIGVSGAQSFGNGIAVAAGRLIIPDNIANAVYEVRATRPGVQTPIWTLALPPGFSPQDVKLGP